MKPGKAIAIHPNGFEEELAKKPTLREAQRAVGGDVQLIKLADGRQMLVHEDGLNKHRLAPAKFPTNQKATALALGAGYAVDPYVGVVGRAIILEGGFLWD